MFIYNNFMFFLTKLHREIQYLKESQISILYIDKSIDKSTKYDIVFLGKAIWILIII